MQGMLIGLVLVLGAVVDVHGLRRSAQETISSIVTAAAEEVNNHELRSEGLDMMTRAVAGTVSAMTPEQSKTMNDMAHGTGVDDNVRDMGRAAHLLAMSIFDNVTRDKPYGEVGNKENARVKSILTEIGGGVISDMKRMLDDVSTPVKDLLTKAKNKTAKRASKKPDKPVDLTPVFPVGFTDTQHGITGTGAKLAGDVVFSKGDWMVSVGVAATVSLMDDNLQVSVPQIITKKRDPANMKWLSVPLSLTLCKSKVGKLSYVCVTVKVAYHYFRKLKIWAPKAISAMAGIGISTPGKTAKDNVTMPVIIQSIESELQNIKNSTAPQEAVLSLEKTLKTMKSVTNYDDTVIPRSAQTNGWKIGVKMGITLLGPNIGTATMSYGSSLSFSWVKTLDTSTKIWYPWSYSKSLAVSFSVNTKLCSFFVGTGLGDYTPLDKLGKFFGPFVGAPLPKAVRDFVFGKRKKDKRDKEEEEEDGEGEGEDGGDAGGDV